MGSFFLYRRFLVFAFMVLALGSVGAWGENCYCKSENNAAFPWSSSTADCLPSDPNYPPACASFDSSQKQAASKVKPQADMDAAVKKCDDDFNKSVGANNVNENTYGKGSSSCDVQANEGVQAINSSLGQMSMGMATALSMKDACSKLASIMPTANASLAAFNMVCRSAIDSCVSSCQSAASTLRAQARAESSVPALAAQETIDNKKASEIENTQLRSCINFQKKISVNTGALVQTMLGNNKTAAACNLVVAQTTNGGPSVITGDCTNPANAANPVCKGMNPGAAAKSLGPSGVAADGVGVGSTAPGAAISGLGSGNGFGPEPMVAKKDAGAAGPSGGGGGGGGGIGSGGGLGGGPKKKGSAAAAEPRDTKMYGGFIQGGGSPMGGTAGTDPSASGSSRSGSSTLPGSPEAGKGPDLSKYAPNMKYDPSRNLAGVTGPDGITGPNSNLFDKVKGQYGTQTDHDHLFAPAP